MKFFLRCPIDMEKIFLGTNPKNGKPYTNRLYSIASTRYGDDKKVRIQWISPFDLYVDFILN